MKEMSQTWEEKLIKTGMSSWVCLTEFIQGRTFIVLRLLIDASLEFQRQSSDFFRTFTT